MDRPPAEKFDELVIKVFKGINKRANRPRHRGKCQSEIKQAEDSHLHAKQKEMHVKNHQAQLEADAMYKSLFGGENLEIKRKPLKIKLKHDESS